MFEKLVSGDRIIKIPTANETSIAGDEGIAPYGASGVVIEGERDMKTENRDTGERYVRYGCVILYDDTKYSSPSLDGQWFRVRAGLMKISPDEDLMHEFEMQKIDDLNDEIKRIKEEHEDNNLPVLSVTFLAARFLNKS